MWTRTVEQLPTEGGEGCPRLVKQDVCELAQCQGSPESRGSHDPLWGDGCWCGWPEGGALPDVDCEVSSWFGWSDCSRSCGGGRRERYREVGSDRAI